MKYILALLLVCGIAACGCSGEGPVDKHERKRKARVHKSVTRTAAIVAKERFGHSVVKCYTDKVLYTLRTSTYTHGFFPCLVMTRHPDSVKLIVCDAIKCDR